MRHLTDEGEFERANEEIYRRAAAEVFRKERARRSGPGIGRMGISHWLPGASPPGRPDDPMPSPETPKGPDLLSGGAAAPLED